MFNNKQRFKNRAFLKLHVTYICRDLITLNLQSLFWPLLKTWLTFQRQFRPLESPSWLRNFRIC